MNNKKLRMLVALVTVGLGACADPDSTVSLNDVQSQENRGIAGAGGVNQRLPVNRDILELRAASNPQRNAYFGDLHVHTAYSFDAYAFGTVTTPDEAYRYAQGEAMQHPEGYQVQLRQPLDFYAVTDHAMFLGLVKESADTNSEFSRYDVAKPLHNINAPDNMGVSSLLDRGIAFSSFVPDTLAGLVDGSIDAALATAITKSAWLDTVRAAQDAYTPGIFTTFAAYEYTSSTDQRGNLHRNVIFKGAEKLPAVPFSRLNSQNPEGLWDWMDWLRDQGIESLAIPHNSNGSNGAMFMLTDWAGNPIDNDYAEQRMRNEPLVEVTQVKGTSETHPLLSKNDEWANFEIAPYRVATKLYSEPAGSYVRDAYLRGLNIASKGVVNPYEFGLVGASDTHTGAISQDEETFFSKAGLLDGTAERRGSIPASFLYGTVMKWSNPDMVKAVDNKDYLASSSFEYWSASGLAAVWAEENTRESIYEAFRRKETFATSGPRISVRFFAGYKFEDEQLQSPQLAQIAYDSGVTMGGELKRHLTRQPRFLVWAAAAPMGAKLQRAQVIKGYVKNGEHVEKVFDVACSDGLAVNPTTHRCPDNGAAVDLSDCSISANSGAAQLKALWQDPEFEPGQEAFYYVRVLENPTCRWSTWDAVRAGVTPRSDLPQTLQERAWSSPIWYRTSFL